MRLLSEALPGNTEWGKGLAAERRLDLGPQCPGQQPGRDWLQALRLCHGRAGTPTSPCQLREPGRGSLRPSGTVLVGRGPSACASLKGPSRALLWLGGWCDPPSLSSPSLVIGVAPFTLGPLLKGCLGTRAENTLSSGGRWRRGLWEAPFLGCIQRPSLSKHPVSLHATQSADPPLHHPLVRAVGTPPESRLGTSTWRQAG